MACPLSLGDILAVTKICYTVGKTLTTGRGEAIEEFKGVQSQLYALGEALNALYVEVKKPDSVFARGDTAKVVDNLVWNCSTRLGVLESIITKYSEAMDSEGTRKSWKQEIHDNWMRVMWTKEGKELTALATELTLHTNAINTLILATNSKALQNIDTTTGNIDKKSNKILDGIEKLLSRPYCSHKCSDEEHSASLPSTSGSSSPLRSKSPTERPQTAPQTKPLTRRMHHPDGLPELEISEERADGRHLICGSAQLKGLHFLAPQRPGKTREDLFQCNCKGLLRSALSNNGYHKKQLKDYFCGPKTFIAQSYFETDTPLGGRGWWLLQTATKLGTCKNLFIELKDPDKRSQFAKIVASMLRTNVARNVLSGIIEPFDLVREAKNGPKPQDRLQIAWSYDERTVGRKGTKMHIDKLPWAEKLEFSDPVDEPGNRYLYEETVQDFFTETNPPGFSWYRVAMFESINITSSIEDNDLEDAYFFLDHFHTAVELKVQLSDPRDPNNIAWGVGEFGGADMTYSNRSENDKPTNQLMFTVSRFKIEKGKHWDSPRPVDCSLHFTFLPGYSDSLMTMYRMWKKYESLSTTTGSATEFAHAKPETPTKENPRFLMRIKNAILTDISTRGKEGPVSLDRYGFDSFRTFRDCWLLGRRSDNPKFPLKFILRSIEQDIHCHTYLSTKDARGLRKSEKSTDKVVCLELHGSTPNENGESKTSWSWIYPRDPYGAVTPPGINISGMLKLSFASDHDLDNFLRNMRKLLDISGGVVNEYDIPPPHENLVSGSTQENASALFPGHPEDPTNEYPAAKYPPIPWDTDFESDGNDHDIVHELGENNHFIKPQVLITPSAVDAALQRSKTLPSQSGSSHAPRGRTASWSIGLTPTPEQAAIQSQLFHPPIAPTQRSSMYVRTEGKTWEPPRSQYGYKPHPEGPNQDWHQHNTSQLLTMPDASHFTHYTVKPDLSNLDTTNNPNPRWTNASYPNYNHVPRAWVEPIDIHGGISPTQSPGSRFPENTPPIPYGPPNTLNTQEPSHHHVSYSQQWQQDFNNHRAGLKRCVVISDYQRSPLYQEVSLQAGQVHDVIPQPDNSPWVWVEGHSYGPSGFAPKRNLRDYYLGPKL